MPVNENIEKLNYINIFNFLKLTKLKMGFIIIIVIIIIIKNHPFRWSTNPKLKSQKTKIKESK